jgi:DNA-binding transcriptional LysR family regulator
MASCVPHSNIKKRQRAGWFDYATERWRVEMFQLEQFVAVAEERSFTKAAERVFRTQGAVSVAIRKLEEEIGIPLLVRDSRECLLTKAGEELLAHATRMLGLRDELTRNMRQFKNLGTGTVSIAAHESAAEYLLPPALAEFNVQNPKIRIEARLCDGNEIAHLVEEREVDLGFGISQTNHRGLCTEILYIDPLVLVVPPGHPLAHKSTVSIMELTGERFFTHSRHTTMTDTVERVLASHRVKVNIAARLWKFETIKDFVRRGAGVAIMPASVISSTDVGTLIPIHVNELNMTRSIEVIYGDKGSLLPAPAALLDLLRCWRWQHSDHERTVQATPTHDFSHYELPAVS